MPFGHKQQGGHPIALLARILRRTSGNNIRKFGYDLLSLEEDEGRKMKEEDKIKIDYCARKVVAGKSASGLAAAVSGMAGLTSFHIISPPS